MDKIRVRMAPSPTGLLHIGTARTALFNYLFARKNNGTFILRIEDTDLERSDQKFEENILEGLAWLGITWDEGAGKGGDYGPYRQSERLNTYEKAIIKLLDEEKAFYCGHTKEELEAEQKEQIAKKEAPRHVCNHREESRAEGIIRIKNNVTGKITFTDTIREEISFEATHLGDFSLAKSPRVPLYNFAVVTDDEEMKISHVIRGEDHIPNTPKQILIQRALGWREPQYAHLPLILGPDKSKLSKRHGATSINAYQEQGYLPEALVNFMAFLGWNPGDEQEIFTLAELEKEFSLEKVQRAGAVFNIEKLNWMNGEYIRNLPVQELADYLQPYIPKGNTVSQELLENIARVEQPRLKTLSEITEKSAFFFANPTYEPSLLLWKGNQSAEEASSHLTAITRILRDIDNTNFVEDNIKEVLMPYAEENGRGNVLWPLRVSLSGLKASPDPMEILSIIKKDASIERISKAIKLLYAHINQ